MAETCECRLEIYGSGDKVKELLKLVKSGRSKFDFNRLIPYPKRFTRLDRIASKWVPGSGQTWRDRPLDGYNQGGKEWLEEHWGVKCNSDDAQVYINHIQFEDGSVETQATITFETPWFPPTPVIEKAAELFPMLRFELNYFVCGHTDTEWFNWRDS